MRGGFEVKQGLYVERVQVTRAGVTRIELHDGTARVGRVIWRDELDAADRDEQLRIWMLDRTPVTYVRHGRVVSLVDEQRLLERAFD